MPVETQALAAVRAAGLRADWAGAERLAGAGLTEYPHSQELRRALAGIYRQTQRETQAETLLREVLEQAPDDMAAAFTLAEMLIESGRGAMAGKVLETSFSHASIDAELAIRAIELLDEAGRKRAAAGIAETALAAYPADTRLHAYAGMLEVQLGEFAQAREHYLYALEQDTRACEWHVPHGLSSVQRYSDATHADFARFRAYLRRTDLSDKARSTLLFALGKAHDDIGDYAQATGYFRQANALAHGLTAWSRKNWRRAIESRLAVKPFAQRLPPAEFTPVFIVGMPRSGTTLAAELLARHPLLRNRGELPWLARLAQSPALAGNPPRAALERCATTYAAQLCQDDSGDAQWFIDKQPLNFRYVDLIMALWPNARIVHCQRNARDTALSLWTQSFLEDVQGYAFDFANIALVMRDEQRLMAHWRKHYPAAIRELRYEELAPDPEQQIAQLAAWLGLPDAATAQTNATAESIGTASLWQARQPVYTRSVERWRNYVPFLQELEKFAAQ